MLELTTDGYLPPGIHPYTYADFEEQFVADFKTSQTRREIRDKAFQWISKVRLIAAAEEVWINGSYTTGKVNPNDIDMVIFYKQKIFKSKTLYDALKQLQLSSKSYRCDAYYSIIIDKDVTDEVLQRRAFWKGQFGFDRVDQPKGIVVMQWKEVIKGIKGGVL